MENQELRQLDISLVSYVVVKVQFGASTYGTVFSL